MQLEKYGNNSHLKKGIKSNPANYRPISITTAVGNIIESIIRDIIVAYINDYNLYMIVSMVFVNIEVVSLNCYMLLKI